MFKKAHITILLSVLLHVVVIALLNNSQTMVIPNTNTPPASIKSYIYKKPKKIIEELIQTEPKEINKTKDTEKDKPLPQEKINEQPKVITQKQDVLPSNVQKHAPETVIEAAVDNVTDNAPTSEVLSPPPVNPDLTEVKKPPTQGFSYRSLQQLRDKIQQQTNAQVQSEFTQPNTGSVMHGTPTLVPHSTVLPTVEEKKKQATLTMSTYKSVIKGDDGSCTIIEDLSAIGVEGVKAVSSFACGNTKFDRSFREHMNKVRKKLGKK